MSFHLFLWLSVPALAAVLLTVLAALRSAAQRDRAWLAFHAHELHRPL